MRDILLTALAPVSWGTTYLITTQLLPADRPLLIAALRALPIGLLLIVATRRLPSGIWWWRSFVLGMLNFGLFFALLFVAAVRLPGGVAATLGAIQPLIVVMLAGPVLGERPGMARVLAALTGVIGVGMLVLGPAARLDTLGIIAAVAATTMMGLGTMLAKRWGSPTTPLAFTAWQLVAGGVVLVPLALLVEGAPPALPAASIAGFLYLGLINTGIAYALWFRGIQLFSASQITFLSLLTPVVAVLAGFVVLHQTLSALQVVGVLIVLASIVGAQHVRRPAHGAA